MRSKKTRSPIWFLHPLVGLKLRDRKHDLDRPLYGDATLLSWLGLVQFAKLSDLFGLCLDVDYHSISLGEDEAVGFAPEGFIKRFTFYRIQLGLVIQAID